MDRRKFIKASGSTLALMSIGNIDSEVNWTDKKLLKPNALKRGDKVAVLAPGGAVFNQKYVHSFSNVLSNLGLRPVIFDSCSSQHGQFSAKAEKRAEEINLAFRDPDVKAIIGMRGGSGCAKTLPFLDYSMIAENPKVIMGFSDITSLLCAITSKSGLVTYHGPVGYSTWNDFSVNHWKKACQNREPFDFRFDDKSAVQVLSKGTASGRVVAGNLTVLTTLIGTGYLPPMDDTILFLEEIDEEPYAIDRMLTQWQLAGLLSKLKGVVLGDFKRCVPEEPEKSHTLNHTLRSFFGNLKIPVLQGGDFGHTLNKWTLPLGCRVQIDTGNLSIKLLEQSVI